MATFSKYFQEEVRRLARKEAKDDLDRLRKENVELRKLITGLKKRLTTLEQASKRLSKRVPGIAAVAEPVEQTEDQAAERLRITARAVRALRQKLGLTQAEFAQLLGVSGQSVYQWESKEGRLQLRRTTRQAFLEVRTMGMREARAKLQK